MAAEINQRFTKQQIFEMYANEIYLGQSRQLRHSRIR